LSEEGDVDAAPRTTDVPGLERFVPRFLDTWDRDADGRSWQVRHGTLCFIDISGFTALSERLARRGRVGSEELVGVLNRVFGAMLREVYRRGGSLIKFGGDALFLMFEGDDHALQGTSAAVGMRRSLRESSKIPTSVGRLHLRMSIGLESGPIHMFRAGRIHQELMVVGPTATAVSQMESLAQAGEIVVGPQTRALLPPGSADRPKNDGFILKWRTERAEPSGLVERSLSDPSAVENGVPIELRELLASGEVENEHRTGTIAFVEFRGVDDRLANEGPAVVADLIDEFVCAAGEEARAEGVTFLATDLGKDGGKVLLSTGAPFTKEDDEGRMLRACRGILERDLTLRCRIGVNRGHVFTGEVGTPFRSTYIVMGDTTNLAARMMAASSTGEIYAAPSIVARARTQFETTVVPPFAAKGKTEPVRALSVGPEVGPKPNEMEDDLPLVGRDEELATLVDTLRRDLAGESGVAVLTGIRGMGKTRLVSEALDALGDVDSFTIQADPYTVASPYRAFRDTARRMLGIQRGANEEMATTLLQTVAAVDESLLPLAPLLGDIAHVEIEPTLESRRIDLQYRSERLADLVVDLLARTLTSDAVLVVEDAHWMDDASQVILRRLERASLEYPWAMLVTRRPEETGFVPSEARVIELGPINEASMVEAITHATPSVPLRPDDVQRMVSRLGGNPLFLIEIARAIEQHGEMVEVPDSVEEVMGARVDELDPLPRQLLRSASVLGRSFRPAIFNEILGDEIALDAAARDVLSEFLEPDGEERLRFRHALLRDSLYGSLSFKRRRELHLRAGRAIERAAGSDAAAVAGVLDLHYLEGHDFERAFRFARLAGDDATSRYANVEAAVHYERAIDAARHIGHETNDAARVWRSLGDVLLLAGRYGSAADAYGRAQRLLADPVDRAEVLLARAQSAAQAGSYRSALSLITRARTSLATDLRPRARKADARLAAYASTTRIYQQQPEKALAAAVEAIDAARWAEEPAALAEAMQRHDIAQLILGRFDQARYLEEAARIFADLGDLASLASATSALGGRAYLLGQWTKAREHYEETQRTDAMTGNEAGSASAAANLAEVLVNQRRFDEAIGILTGARRTALASEYRDLLPFVGLNLGRGLAGAGRFEDAESTLRETIEEAESLGQPMSVAEARLDLASVLVDLDDLAGADAVVAEVPDEMLERFGPAAALTEAKIAMAKRDRRAGFEAAMAAIETLRGTAADYELAPLLFFARSVVEDETARAKISGEIDDLAARYDMLVDLPAVAGI
jgi:predicted ATPase/class 3 adenylate cyclase